MQIVLELKDLSFLLPTDIMRISRATFDLVISVIVLTVEACFW